MHLQGLLTPSLQHLVGVRQELHPEVSRNGRAFRLLPEHPQAPVVPVALPTASLAYDGSMSKTGTSQWTHSPSSRPHKLFVRIRDWRHVDLDWLLFCRRRVIPGLAMHLSGKRLVKGQKQANGQASGQTHRHGQVEPPGKAHRLQLASDVKDIHFLPPGIAFAKRPRQPLAGPNWTRGQPARGWP